MSDEVKFLLALVLCACTIAAICILGDWLDGDDCMARITLLDPAWTETLICEDGTADVVEIRGQTFLRCTCPAPGLPEGALPPSPEPESP